MEGLVGRMVDDTGSEVRIRPLAQRSPQYGFWGEKPDIGEGVMYAPLARSGMYKLPATVLKPRG